MEANYWGNYLTKCHKVTCDGIASYLEELSNVYRLDSVFWKPELTTCADKLTQC